MGIENSTLYHEITKVVESGAKNVHWTIRAEFHVNGKTFPPLKVVSLENDCNYDENFAESLLMEFTLGPGTYNRDIVPYKNDIMVTIFKEPIKETTSDTNYNAKVSVIKYHGTLLDGSSSAMEGNTAGSSGHDSSDLSSMKAYHIQLVNQTVELTRNKGVGGVFTRTPVDFIMRTVLGSEGQNLPLTKDLLVSGVDIVLPVNPEVRDHIVVPHGLKLVDLADHIQNKCGGIYPTGCGCFLQAGIWYLFPKYDITRFNTTPRTLTIVNVPANKMPGIERTFLPSNNRLTILATGQVKHHDETEQEQKNLGNGVRFTDARKILDGFGTAVGNKLTVDRGKNNSEFAGVIRKNLINIVTPAVNAITSNIFAVTSKLARRSGSVVELLWENADPGLIYPGMPVRLLYLENDKVKELYGLVIRQKSRIALSGKSITDTRYISNVKLTLFVGIKEK